MGEEGGADLVPAKDVAELLRDAHAPICFLNACRSGMATLKMGDAEKGGFSLDASLAMKFLERGVRLVVGMAWSLWVTAARIMMTRLYDVLTKGEEPGAALNLARQALHEDELPVTKGRIAGWSWRIGCCRWYGVKGIFL